MPNDSPVNPIRRVRQQPLRAGGGDALVVDVAGDVDLHCSLEFQQSLMKLVDRAPKRIVINLTEVPYMDSSGVASLVKLLSRVRRANIELRLCGLSERVRSVFEITRLDTVFSIAGSAEEALS